MDVMTVSAWYGASMTPIISSETSRGRLQSISLLRSIPTLEIECSWLAVLLRDPDEGQRRKQLVTPSIHRFSHLVQDVGHPENPPTLLSFRCRELLRELVRVTVKLKLQERSSQQAACENSRSRPHSRTWKQH